MDEFTHSTFTYTDKNGDTKKTDIPRWTVRTAFSCQGLIGDISLQLANKESQANTADTMLALIDKTLAPSGKTFDDLPEATVDTVSELFNHILKVEGFIQDEKPESKN